MFRSKKKSNKIGCNAEMLFYSLFHWHNKMRPYQVLAFSHTEFRISSALSQLLFRRMRMFSSHTYMMLRSDLHCVCLWFALEKIMLSTIPICLTLSCDSMPSKFVAVVCQIHLVVSIEDKCSHFGETCIDTNRQIKVYGEMCAKYLALVGFVLLIRLKQTIIFVFIFIQRLNDEYFEFSSFGTVHEFETLF